MFTPSSCELCSKFYSNAAYVKLWTLKARTPQIWGFHLFQLESVNQNDYSCHLYLHIVLQEEFEDTKGVISILEEEQTTQWPKLYWF